MAELKTKENKASVKKFLDSIEDETKRKDCYTVLGMMKKITKEEPKMWGPSIVGFGSYHYKYASGHEGDACLAGFSPRKKAITIYLMGCYGNNSFDALFEKLGKHKRSKGCLYIKDLKEINKPVLEQMIKKSFTYIKDKYGSK